MLGQEFPFDQHQTIEILLSGNILQYYGVILLKRQERNSSGNQLFFSNKISKDREHFSDVYAVGNWLMDLRLHCPIGCEATNLLGTTNACCYVLTLTLLLLSPSRRASMRPIHRSTRDGNTNCLVSEYTNWIDMAK